MRRKRKHDLSWWCVVSSGVPQSATRGPSHVLTIPKTCMINDIVLISEANVSVLTQDIIQ